MKMMTLRVLAGESIINYLSDLHYGNKTNDKTKGAPKFPEQVTGMYILAQALKRLGLDTVYGLVGIPLRNLLMQCRRWV